MNDEKKKPGCLWPALWGVASALGTLVCAVIVGLAAADSESAGVMATNAVALPVGFLWAGSLAAIIVHFVKRDNKGLRYGAPVGCGCVGAILMLLTIFVFFAAIFPAL
jgi:hypothetical protein